MPVAAISWATSALGAKKPPRINKNVTMCLKFNGNVFNLADPLGQHYFN